MHEITQILKQIDSDPEGASEQLLPLVYEELRSLAACRMQAEELDHTLTGTALVHEAYLRLAGSGRSDCWQNRGHFFAAAAEAMRRILVEQARRKRRRQKILQLRPLKRDSVCQPNVERNPDLLEIDEALSRFAEHNPEKARLVELRYFAGLTVPECAEVLNISVATANRYWIYARAWLSQELSSADDASADRRGRKKRMFRISMRRLGAPGSH
ncbi:MAG: ECF-type sigma factor [Fuerstiella sp.]